MKPRAGRHCTSKVAKKWLESVHAPIMYRGVTVDLWSHYLQRETAVRN